MAINSDDWQDGGLYNFIINAWQGTNTLNVATTTLTIEIYDTCQSLQPLTIGQPWNQWYRVKNPEKFYKHPYFEVASEDCGEITYSATFADGSLFSSIPGLVAYDSFVQEFTFGETVNTALGGTYDITILGNMRMPSYPTGSVTF